MIFYFLDCLVEQNILGVEKVEFRLAKIEYLVEEDEFRVAQFTNTENRKRSAKLIRNRQELRFKLIYAYMYLLVYLTRTNIHVIYSKHRV